MPTALFLDQELGDFLSEKKRAMLDAIDNLDGDAALKAKEGEPFSKLVEPYEVEPLRLVEDLISWDKEDAVLKKGGPKTDTKYKVVFFVPFQGGHELFRCYTLTQHVNERVSADLFPKEGELALPYELDDLIPAKFRARFDRDLDIIRFWLKQIGPVVLQHNESLKAAARERLQERQALLKERDWEQEIGFPRRKKAK